MDEKLVNILNAMAEYLSIAQMKKLQEVLLEQLADKLSDALICKYLSISMEQLAKVKAGQN